MKNLIIDRDECTSCEQCAEDLDTVFAMDDDDIAVLVDGWQDEADEDEIQEQIDACPGECIAWEE